MASMVKIPVIKIKALLLMVIGLKQSADPTVFVNVDVFCSRFVRKSGHTHNFSCDGNYETGTGSNFNLTDGNNEIFWTS